MISIIIPTFNEEKVIKNSIENITSKLTIPYQVIVSDDESTDRTVEIAEQLPIQVVIHSHTNNKPRTISGNRNNGAHYATGEYLVFLDASCRIQESPDTFFNKALENFKDERVVGITGWVMIDPKIATRTDNIILGMINRSYLIFNNVLHKGAATGKFQMFRRNAFEKIGGYNEKLVTCEDNDIFARIARIGTTHFDTSLSVFHPGRREHTMGWIRLLSIWSINSIWFLLFNKVLAKEWTIVR